MIAFTIIIPVYNAESTLDVTIKSVLSQTYNDFEVILINDGSSDNSPAICDSYSERFEFIKTVHSSNMGVSFARNLGIKNAVNEWLLFLDADDTLLKDTLLNFSLLIKKNADLNIFVSDFIYEQGDKESYFLNKSYFNKKIYDPLDLLCKQSLHLRPGNFITNKRILFNTNITIYEDTAYSFELLNDDFIFVGDFVSMRYTYNINGASKIRHFYKNEWVYNLCHDLLMKKYKFFLTHLLQRMYVHLKQYDIVGAICLFCQFTKKTISKRK